MSLTLFSLFFSFFVFWEHYEIVSSFVLNLLLQSPPPPLFFFACERTGKQVVDSAAGASYSGLEDDSTDEGKKSSSFFCLVCVIDVELMLVAIMQCPHSIPLRFVAANGTCTRNRILIKSEPPQHHAPQGILPTRKENDVCLDATHSHRTGKTSR